MAQRKSVEIMISLDKKSEIPLYQQIYEQIRDAAFSGALAEGHRLPSIRSLSRDQNVSHTTVEQAYLQLSVEGIVRNVPRSGYVVNHLDTEFLQIERKDSAEEVRRIEQARDQDAFFAENNLGGKTRYDFSYANLPADSFPVKSWRKILDEVLYAKTAPQAARYSYADETTPLRRELAGYLARARGVSCVPEQVIVQAGTDGALNTLLQLFDREHDVIGMEEPGYATVHEVASRNGFRLAPLPTLEGVGAFMEAVERARPKLVYTTPSHQFPTGKVLSVDTRTRLIKWARENDAFVVEDDSCNEYRYNTRPIPSLQSLDAFGRVVYLGNFSKVLSPSMRVAYLVLPPALLERYLRLFNYAHPPVAWLTQEVLARFIGEGYWDAHVRRMAQALHKRHDLLYSCLQETMGERVGISGADAGMHLFVTVDNGMTQTELMVSARVEGANVYGTKRCWFANAAPESCLMMGFSAIEPEDIAPGVAALERAWFPGI